MYNWSVIHGIKRKPHLSVVWNWYHFVAIAILHQPRPTDSADINTRLQLSDTSSIPPMHGGFLLIPGLRRNIKTVFPRYGIPMLKISRSWDRLIFNMGIPILVRRHIYIEMTPSFWHNTPQLILQMQEKLVGNIYIFACMIWLQYRTGVVLALISGNIIRKFLDNFRNQIIILYQINHSSGKQKLSK